MSKLRILYAAGPGNVIGTFRHWQKGEDDPGVPDVAYSRQFFDVCKKLDAEAWVIASHPEPAEVQDGAIRVQHHPIPFQRSSGLKFHLGLVAHSFDLIRSAAKFRADVVIAAQGGHWFLLSLMAAMGVKVIPSLHNTLWLPAVPPNVRERALLRMARPLFAQHSFAILSHPGACADQVNELTSGQSRPVVPFLPLYRVETFAGLSARRPERRPFRVLFAGRIEREKGVFDLLELAKRFAAMGREDIHFEICGRGSALDALREEAEAAGVSARFHLRGFMARPELREMFAACHAVVVPTRSDFAEGFNAVVVEATLCGRPVVTSRLCPALDLVREAAVEVQPEDIDGYQQALLRLCDDEPFYESKRAACGGLGARFVDVENSWGAGLTRILQPLISR